MTDEDTADSVPDDSEPSDSGHENPDTTPEQPDNGNSTPEQPDDTDTTSDYGDSTPDGGDTAPDNGDTEPDNDYPQTPCDPNPCNSIGETGTCIGNSWDRYTCECENNYVWDPPSKKCMKNLCLNNPCNIPNSTGICNPVTETQYACECEENYYWWGVEKGCRDKRRLTLGNICTGQDKCYKTSSSNAVITCPTSESNIYFGQDAYYASLGKCTPQSFSSSSNVVIDNNTGLTWEKSPSSSTYTWADRNTHCNELNSSNYGGKSNWRVPNPLEFLTIVDNSKNNPAINSNFTGMPTEDSTKLWTNNEVKGNTSYAYVFYPAAGFYYGYNDSYFSKTNTLNVLCVSGEEMNQPYLVILRHRRMAKQSLT